MYAVLHIADFPLQALLRLDPTAAGKPVALLDGPHRNAVIVACTREAAAAEVRRGQTPSQALVYCRDLFFRVPNPAAAREARDALLAAAFAVSPDVEETAPGICTLAVSGIDPAVRGRVLGTAIERLRVLGLVATGGIASTPLLALYAARYVPVSGIWHLESASALAPLPLEVAEPPPELIPTLAGWGIRTLGQMTALPKAEIAHRLGPAGLALWERAAGEVIRPLDRATPARAFVANLDCEHETETLEPVLFIVRRFVDRLSLDLENAGMAAVELSLQLGLADETVHRHAIRLPEPTTEADVLFRTLNAYLGSLRTAAAVISVGLAIEPARIAARQQGLFDAALRDPHGFAETLDRATAIVGSGRVGAPELEGVHRPDAFRMMRPAAVLSAPQAKGSVPNKVAGLPLRRFRPPLVATVELKGQFAVGHPPSAVSYVWTETIRGAVRALAGPWNSSGEWWQADRAWQREEWDAELDTGGVYRLLRTPAGWFVEGEYD